MRIAIATFPVDCSANYGCVLQNYALQQVLLKLGHIPFTIKLADIVPKKESLPCLHRIFLKKQKKIFSQRTVLSDFCEQHIAFTHQVELPLKPDDLAAGNFEAYIAGSDQIWRPSYTQQYFLRYAMLDFTRSLPVKRIAYAISFGNAKWSFSRRLLFFRLRKLVSKFDILSMREEEGVNICRRFLRQNHVPLALDPTLLLDGDNYQELSVNGRPASGQLVTYILDDTPAKREAANQLFRSGEFSGRLDFSTKPCDGKIQPQMEDWLAAFRTARFIVTDSFHGTVFAILFQRPFITIANYTRGLSRFISLLGKLQLNDRLVLNPEAITMECCAAAIDFPAVHARLAVERQKSLELLRQGLADK